MKASFPRPKPFSPPIALVHPSHPTSKQRERRTELVEAEDEQRLVDLEAEDLGLDEREGLAVDLDEAFAGLAVGDSSCRLLLAEALD